MRIRQFRLAKQLRERISAKNDRPVQHPSGEELFALVDALLPLRCAERLDPSAPGIENSPRRKPETNQIVAILPWQNQIVLAAIEAST
jgi:hypothetical protein